MKQTIVAVLALLAVALSVDQAFAESGSEITISVPSTVKAKSTVNISVRLVEVFDRAPILGVPLFIGTGDKYYCSFGRYNSTSQVTATWKAPATPGRYIVESYFSGGYGYRGTVKSVVVTVVK